MLMPRFPNGCFRGFCHFRMEKKEFAIEINPLYDFPYFLMHIRPFDLISNYKKEKPHLEFTCSKSTTKAQEQFMKHV